MATEQQKRKAAAQTGFYILVVTAIVVVANLLSAGAHDRFDMTKTERYTLSKGSSRLVQSLKEPIQVEVYVKTGLAQLDAFVRDLTDLLKEYERTSAGKFVYTVIEPDTDELKEKAKEAGLQEQPFGEASATGDTSASITQGYMGIVFKYGSEKAVIPALHPARGDGLEFFITNKIREIRDKNDSIKHKIGVISGKDELKLSDKNLIPRQGQQGSPSLQDIIVQNFPFYDVQDVDLAGGETPIDPSFAGVIITQPGQDYTDKELRRVDEFLMQGNKSLVVIASAVNIKAADATMNAELNLHNLDKLLTGYGIEMKKDALFDHGAQFRMPVMTQMGGVGWFRHPGIAHVINDVRFGDEEKLLDTGFPAFFRMDELMFPFPSSLVLLKDKQPADVSLKAVARTTPPTSVVTGDSVDMGVRDAFEPKPPFEQHVIAAEAEGKLKSAFAGKPGDGVEAPERAKESSRVLVISSSQFITNPFAYAGNGPEMTGQMAQFAGMGGNQELLMLAQPYAQKYLTPTILSLKNTFDWMTGDADLIAASAKILGEANLTYSSVAKPSFKVDDSDEEIKKKDEEYRMARKDLQRKVQWTLTLGVPLFFAALGLLRWRRREALRTAQAA
ncbi:MAG TPA: GldG family protein [Polyangiaceae bacterium]|nr:GldG family protein [Polyangiaceae bacterium]